MSTQNALSEFGGGVEAGTEDWRDAVVSDSKSGFLVDVATTNPANDAQRLKLLRCPACGEQWLRQWRDALNDPLARHLDEAHGPADFGLSPLGERGTDR
jgi:hypothetical protein